VALRHAEYGLEAAFADEYAGSHGLSTSACLSHQERRRYRTGAMAELQLKSLEIVHFG